MPPIKIGIVNEHDGKDAKNKIQSAVFRIIRIDPCPAFGIGPRGIKPVLHVGFGCVDASLAGSKIHGTFVLDAPVRIREAVH